MLAAAEGVRRVTADILFLPPDLRDKAIVAHEAALAAYLRTLDDWEKFFPEQENKT